MLREIICGCTIIGMLLFNTVINAEEKNFNFDDNSSINALIKTGIVTIDTVRKHSGTGSLKLKPGARAVIPLRKNDGTGRVELWVFEDNAAPQKPKKVGAGAMWGIQSKSGRLFTMGAIYARYLSGDKTYACAYFEPAKQEHPWSEVQYLGLKRKAGWHQWIIDFAPDKGIDILYDGKSVNARRKLFNWNKTMFAGFNSLVFMGDTTKSGQVLLIDDVKVTLFGPATVKPKWPPIPPQPPAELHFPDQPTIIPSVYYKQWKYWPGKDDTYFPIAVWLQDPKLAPRYKAAGFNLYVGLWKGPTEKQMDVLRKADMPVICAQNEYALKHLDNPLFIGWMHGDEPDNAHKFKTFWKNNLQKLKETWPQIKHLQTIKKYRGYGLPVPPAWIVRGYQKIKVNDPNRPIMLNLGQGVAWSGWKGRGERTGKLEDYPEYIKGSDIVSFDIYPAKNKNLTVSNALWFVPLGVQRLRKWSQNKKMVWNCIECTASPPHKPTPLQVRTEVWMSIIHGSRGLIYFVHQFKPKFNSHALLDDPEMLTEVTRLNHQIHTLAPVVNCPDIMDKLTVQSSSKTTPVHAVLKDTRDARYIFAVAMYQNKTTALFKIAGMNGTNKVEVIGENRTIVSKNGDFTDSFNGYEVHLYKLAK